MFFYKNPFHAWMSIIFYKKQAEKTEAKTRAYEKLVFMEELNPYAELFNLTRNKLEVNGFQLFINRNTAVAKDFSTKSQRPSIRPDELWEENWRENIK